MSALVRLEVAMSNYRKSRASQGWLRRLLDIPSTKTIVDEMVLWTSVLGAELEMVVSGESPELRAAVARANEMLGRRA